MPREHQQHQLVADLVDGHRLPVLVAGREEQAEDVLAGPRGAPLGDEGVELLVQALAPRMNQA